jgi:hypothetical protein
MVGLDRDRCALGARVDPYALSPAGEVEAIRAGRKTYHYRNGELDPRDRWSIPGSPPTHDLIVLAEHDCTPIPDSWLMPPAPPTPPKPPKEMF